MRRGILLFVSLITILFVYVEEFIDCLIENQEWFATRPIADLSKLPEHTKTDELDMNGTFKKLQID